MLKFNEDERISWDDYFNHPFLKTGKSSKTFNFDFKSPTNFKNVNYYCDICKENFVIL